MPTDPLRTARPVAGTTVGSILVVAGVVMLVTPGPGLIAIAAGTAVLSRHHAGVARFRARWADRLRTARPGSRADGPTPGGAVDEPGAA